MRAELPVPYRIGAHAAKVLMKRYPHVDKDDAYQEAALLVAEGLAQGKTLFRVKYLYGSLVQRLVLKPRQWMKTETQWQADEPLPTGNVGGTPENLRRQPKCAQTGHDERRGGKCTQCKKDRDTRYRLRKRGRCKKGNDEGQARQGRQEAA